MSNLVARGETLAYTVGPGMGRIAVGLVANRDQSIAIDSLTMSNRHEYFQRRVG